MADQKPNLREAGEKDAKARDQALQAAVKQIGTIRKLVALNLSLGIAVVLIATAGKYLLP